MLSTLVAKMSIMITWQLFGGSIPFAALIESKADHEKCHATCMGKGRLA